MSDWYAEGLRFGCAACGRCCTGEPGYVWVAEPEIGPIAAALGIAPEVFSRTYLRGARGRLSIRERTGGDCMLLDETTRRCRVYAVRPVQCRTWPWWRENLESPESWRERTAHCPGIGCGENHGQDAIDRAAAEDAALNDADG